MLRVVLLLQLLQVLLAEVTIVRVVQTIYDQSPKLRIRGSGFDASDSDINIDLGVAGQNYLVRDRDFMISKDSDGDGIILKLLSNRRWADLTARVPPVALVCSAVRFASNPNPDENMLEEPVIIAQVILVPSVYESDVTLYATTTNELRIKGTGLIGAKKLDLYFNPPLAKDVSYEIVNVFPLMKNEAVLRLRNGYAWRETPGPLDVVGVDTGGGPVKINGDEGIQVANVVENEQNLNSVEVTMTVSTQFVYTDDRAVFVKGHGFNPVSTMLSFKTHLRGGGVNYSTMSLTETSMMLRLTPGSVWRRNFDLLPGALTVTAINVGGGFVMPAGSNFVDIAMVFERPHVDSSNAYVFRTVSQEITIYGTGFPFQTNTFSVQLEFSPPLEENVDYYLTVLERKSLKLTLLEGRAWRTTAGPLLVTRINTRPDQNGWLDVPSGGVTVAQILDDNNTTSHGCLFVRPTNGRYYQSSTNIIIFGACFVPGMTFNLSPRLVVGVDYYIAETKSNEVWLKLMLGKKWRSTPGSLNVLSIGVNGVDYPLAGSQGYRVAVVLEDPVITTALTPLHNSQSRILTIHGSGFTNSLDVTLTLTPTSAGTYKVLRVNQSSIDVQLMSGAKWLPVFMSPGHVRLQVASIDTGAGVVEFPLPVDVAMIIEDRADVECDNSCEFAFDGVCDDNSSPHFEKYHSGDDSSGYDDYYSNDAYSAYTVSACMDGTDCTDCGGVDAIVSKEFCTNDCVYARDGVCDDPRGFGYCALGSDCEDCGPVSPSGSENDTAVESVLQNTGKYQKIYNDAPLIYVTGTVLHPTGSSFRWSNQMRGDGIDYELKLVDHSTMTLHRVEGFLWERAFLHLPTVLYVEAINDGQGSVKFRQLPGLGVAVATIFERPTISFSNTKLYRTQSRTLHIQGSGFPTANSGFSVSLQFSPPLRLHNDYDLQVMSQTDLFVNLLNNAVWTKQPGPLMVSAVNTAGGEDHWVWLAGDGVQVAVVQEDPGVGAWIQQAFMIGGAVVAVSVSLGICYRRGVAHAIAGVEPKVEIRYIKVPASEYELEMMQRNSGQSSNSSMPKLVSASSVIESSDGDVDIENGNFVNDSTDGQGEHDGVIRDADYSDSSPQPPHASSASTSPAAPPQSVFIVTNPRESSPETTESNRADENLNQHLNGDQVEVEQALAQSCLDESREGSEEVSTYAPPVLNTGANSV